MAYQSKSLICVLGPTAVGKTDLAITLAHHLNTEILSADSRQFYRELPIGSAQPAQTELDAIPHHFIADRSVKVPLTASDFADEALQQLATLFKRKDYAILVGGSGFYVKALLEGLDHMPSIAPETREALNQEYEANGLESLVRELKNVDDQAYHQIDLYNPRRVIRALEVYRETGVPLSAYWRQTPSENRPFDSLKLGLYLPRNELHERIERRCEQMIEEGLLDEVERLYPYRNYQVLQTVGYQEFFDYLDGKSSFDEAMEIFKKRTRQYAKRQLTWFRKDEAIAWFKPDEAASVKAYVEQWLEQRGN